LKRVFFRDVTPPQVVGEIRSREAGEHGCTPEEVAVMIVVDELRRLTGDKHTA
jgi:hypothetical protein